MKKEKITFSIALILSVAFVIVFGWNELTRPLGSYYDPNELRITFANLFLWLALISLVLTGLLLALKRQKIWADIAWVFIAPVLVMLAWDTITKNLIERGLLSQGWSTDSAYLGESGAVLHRGLWIFSGALIAVPFLINVYFRIRTRK